MLRKVSKFENRRERGAPVRVAVLPTYIKLIGVLRAEGRMAPGNCKASGKLATGVWF